MDDMILTELLIILSLVLANGIFAGAEIAIVALRKTRLQELVANGSRNARAVWALRENPERFLATVQIGVTVVSATAAAFGGASLSVHFVPVVERISWLPGDADDVALGLVVALISYLSIVLGELVPKSLALQGAERYSLIMGRPLLVLSFLSRPLVWFLTSSSNVILKPFGDRTTFTETRHSPEELQQILHDATASGSLHPEAGEIASRALDFPELNAVDVMVPRQSVLMVRRHAGLDEVRALLLEHAHTRVPVYDGTPDNVVGYVHVKDLLAFAWENQLFVLEDVLRPAVFVPETQRAIKLLQDMRRRHNPFAIVIDEAGGMSGIVTMEDLLEELVGEIFSEHEEREPRLIHPEPDGSFTISGMAPVREVNRDLELDLPEGDWTTIAGLCIALAERIPKAGEKLTTGSGIELEILDATVRRIRSVRLRRPPEHDSEMNE